MDNNIEISDNMRNMERDWKEIQKHVQRVPRELSDACNKAVMDAMRDSDEKMADRRRAAAARAGQVLIE